MASLHVILVIASFPIVLCQNISTNDTDQDSIHAYRLYNNCPDGIYYGDVPGVEIYCEAYPWPLSKHELCWRDFWWKTYLDDDAKHAGITNPFDLLSAEGCRANCFCKLSLDMSRFLCLEKGARLGWNRSPPPYTKYKPVFHCDEFSLPELFRLQYLSNGSVEFVVAFSNFAASSTQLNEDMEAHYNLSKAILASGIPVNGWILNTTSTPAAKSSAFAVAESFLYNLSFTNALHRLDLINGYFDPQQPQTTSLLFPDLELLLANVSSSVEFLRVDGFNISTIPDRSPPPFLGILKAITVKNALSFNKMPSWTPNAKNLVVLVLDRVSPSFAWDSLPTIATLKLFSFTNTPISVVPNQLSLATLFPQLEYLDLSNMNMVGIRKNLLSGLSSLRYLDISGNDMSSLPSFSGLTRLEGLGLAGVRVAAANLTQNAGCFYGQTRRLSLSQADAADLSNLLTLDISNYESVTLSDDLLAPLTKLRVLKASCIGWSQIPAAIRYGCRLRELRLGSNRLAGADALPAFLATELTDLSVIDLQNNGMTSLPQSLLSFSKPSYELLEWIRLAVYTNPMNGSACEIRRLETAYGMEVVKGPSGANSSSDRCEFKPPTAAAATAKACKAAEPKTTPTIVIKLNGAGKNVAFISALMIGMISHIF